MVVALRDATPVDEAATRCLEKVAEGTLNATPASAVRVAVAMRGRMAALGAVRSRVCSGLADTADTYDTAPERLAPVNSSRRCGRLMLLATAVAAFMIELRGCNLVARIAVVGVAYVRVNRSGSCCIRFGIFEPQLKT
jgi:hypothetical protein